MSFLFIVTDERNSATITRRALAALSDRGNREIVELTDAHRLPYLLRLVGDEHVDLNNACFAVDVTNQNSWADFNAFLAALRMYERDNARSPLVIRSLNCRV